MFHHNFDKITKLTRLYLWHYYFFLITMLLLQPEQWYHYWEINISSQIRSVEIHSTISPSTMCTLPQPEQCYCHSLHNRIITWKLTFQHKTEQLKFITLLVPPIFYCIPDSIKTTKLTLHHKSDPLKFIALISPSTMIFPQHAQYYHNVEINISSQI